MLPESSVCVGTLRHRRFTPTQHQFTYPLFMVLLEVDRIPELLRVSPLASYNRWNVCSFDERDHFGDPAIPLRERLRRDAASQGVALPDGPIFLLTHLRYFGYCFNPVSFYYCYDRAGILKLQLAEVNNTFGDSENYWLHGANEWPASRVRRFRCAKRMHISPFMSMHMDHTFIFTDPAASRLVVHMNNTENGRVFFDATLQLHRRPWSARAVHQALAQFPWMTAKVIAAIHWEALRLWIKRTPFYPNPGRPPRPEVNDETAPVQTPVRLV